LSDFAPTVPAKTINLSSEDIASFRRVLTSLDEQDNCAGLAEPHEDSLRAIAFAILELRRARAEFLNPAMLGEPAYEMLLRLYVSEDCSDPLTPARLADLCGIPQSSALRWIEYLATRELVTRDRHPKDRRATVIGLGANGKEALRAFLRTIHQAQWWRALNAPNASALR
jgi:DNA-binding MarR family transcriptional regulator